MPKYNLKFDLTPNDMDLIENALRFAAANASDEPRIDAKSANELLGRLHNQKSFYRPKGPYISG
ncbi:hypothetical protein [Poseidonocella sedimentorum]|uniref:Uncharacterized protein n=1 Tax=Poseidonocella sedimentorum TaxID=871652 RepID=A0A1I6CRE1_9RHOB|nr:hypothetical protein [Poseidonocella sedimentorum]SFQ95647.1 hypothetical protein SAMN04515673_101230 [Poseidonocella sedimentorum]